MKRNVRMGRNGLEYLCQKPCLFSENLDGIEMTNQTKNSN